MILQGSSVENNSVIRAEYCVIGSGMGGSAAASKLARAGKDVLLVEAGNSDPAPEQPGASPSISAEHTGRPFGMPVTRCIELGGTSNAWDGICTPLEDIDFAPRPWIEHSGWPISRDDLDPFYAEAARLLGHERLIGLNPDRISSAIRHELHLIDSDPTVLRPKLLEYRARPFRWKQTLLELASSGKLRCLLSTSALELVPSEDGSRISFLKAAAPGRAIRIEAKTFIVSAGALETPRLLLNSRSRSALGVGNDRGLVGRFLMDHPTGPFSMLRFGATARARAYSGLPLSGDRNLMAALTLLPEMQRSVAVPNHYFPVRPCIGPNHVEHNLHLSFLAAPEVRDFTARARAYSGLPLSGDRNLIAALTLLPEIQQSVAVPNHYFLVRPCIGPNHVEHNLHLSFLAAPEVRDFTAHQVAGILTTPNLLYRVLVDKCKVPAWYRYGELFFFAEQLPNPESRIRLSEKSRDSHGYPIASIHWEPCAKDFASLIQFARTVLKRGLNSSQYEIADNNPEARWTQQFTSAAHHLGTARMSDQPCHGVVNADLQVFGVHNLYLCDGSVFATSGSANPALTVTALALRLADYLAQHSA